MAAACCAIATGSRRPCARRLTLVLVHGLEGSSDSRYIRGIAARAWEAGCNVVRMNMRNCGDTDALTPTLYHSGLSGDVGAVVEHYAERFGLERVALVGYSMGGNLVLKLAGEWGNRPPLVRRGRGLPGDRSGCRLRCAARAGQSRLRVAISARADAALFAARRRCFRRFMRPGGDRAGPFAARVRRQDRGSLLRTFAMPTTTTTAPPAPAWWTASPCPR